MNFIDHKYHIWIASLLAGYVQRKGIIKKPKIFELKIIPGVGYVYPAGQWTSLGTGGLAGRSCGQVDPAHGQGFGLIIFLAFLA